MKRNFNEHIKRWVASLDGAWHFSVDRNDVGEEAGWFFGLGEWESVEVPSVWNEESGLLDYEGTCWYEREFDFPGGTLRLVFDAVMTYSKVWLDGEYLGDHYGGFTGFDFIIPAVDSGKHRVTVKADNRFDSHSIPQTLVDWYHYGGIVRSVSAEKLEGVSILRSMFDYTMDNDLKSAICRPRVKLYNAADFEAQSAVTLKLDGKTVFSDTLVVGSGSTEVTLSPFSVDSPKLWNPGEPALYELCIETETDDLYDRIGFRKVEVSKDGVLINGNIIEIHGVNRHDEYPTFGFAFPASRIKHDIELAENLGCNAIRGSHYPNSKKFVDYLDERGMMFWSEIPIWGGGFSADTLGDPIVLERGMNMHREMVNQYYNHPSIIIWGMHNEIPSHSENAYKMSKIYYEFLKANGGNRLVTYASNIPMKDICFEFCDIICLNVYFGWYSGGIEAWDGFITDFCRRRDSLGFKDKPIIFSEFGAAALYGFHDAECPRWSEEYQAKLLRHCLTLFHERPEVVGSFVWQFCDIRTAADMGYTRARGFNNKGILNEWRRPKAAYYAVKECYSIDK